MPLPIRCSKRAKVKSEEGFFIQITESNSTKTLNTLAKKTTLLAEYLRKIRMEGYNSVCYCNMQNRNLVCYFTKIAAKVVLFLNYTSFFIILSANCLFYAKISKDQQREARSEMSGADARGIHSEQTCAAVLESLQVMECR